MTAQNPQILLISKPLTRSRDHGTVELVRTLARAGGHGFGVFVPLGTPPPAPGVSGRAAALPEPAHGFGWRPLGLLRLLAARAGPRTIRHFFFTPTSRVVRILRLLIRLRPGPTVQTLCSAPPDDADLGELVFADRIVALSDHTRDRLLDAGLPGERVRRIHPAVSLEPVPEGTRIAIKRHLGVPGDAQLVLYMGDYDAAGAAETVAAALPRLLQRTGAHAVFACRPKGAGHLGVQAAVEAQIARADRRRVHFTGAIPWAKQLAASADVALFPARRNPAKMDLPLALLHSLAAGVPAVVADRGPLADLVRAGAAIGVAAQRPDELADAAVRLLGSDSARQAASRAARAWSRGDGSVQRLRREHEDLYQELLRASREP